VREICLVHLDKTRPALVLTREAARAAMTKVTVAPITTTIKGLSSELLVGAANGLDHDCVVALDNVITVPVSLLGRPCDHTPSRELQGRLRRRNPPTPGKQRVTHFQFKHSGCV
jgi:mRNA interferase MazF